MNTDRDTDLIDDLRAMPAEASWLEFKKDNAKPELIGKLCSALSNAARIDAQDFAYIVWGIDNNHHTVVGTGFHPDTARQGQQEFPLWLAQCLQPSIAFSFREVAHPDGRVVLLEIPAATHAPVAFNNIAYIRIGSATPKLTNPGRPLVRADRMIDLPPRSRNEALASLMRRMGFCEEQGSGLDKVIAQVELFQLPAPLFREDPASMQVILYGPRSFAEMTPDERLRACYHHAVLKFLSGERMKNASLGARFGIDPKNASQTTAVIKKAQAAGFIKVADPEHPRAGYVPIWA